MKKSSTSTVLRGALCGALVGFIILTVCANVVIINSNFYPRLVIRRAVQYLPLVLTVGALVGGFFAASPFLLKTVFRKPELTWEQSPEGTELGLKPRLISSGWFAAAACIPVLFFMFFMIVIGWSPFSNPLDEIAPGTASLFSVLPVSIAAFLGFTYGVRILNPHKVMSGFAASAHGALVAILSYVLFIMTFVAMAAANTTKAPGDILGGAITVLFAGAVLFGWVIVLAGALGGWFLFKLRQNADGGSELTGPGRTTALYWNAAATAVLLAIVFVCWLPIRKENQKEKREAAGRDLYHAVWSNQPERVQAFLAQGLSADMKDVGGTPLLLTAAEKGHTRIVKILVDNGANPNVTDDRPGRSTPLTCAATNGDVESIRALLDHGARVDAPDAFGRTPLLLAAWVADRETVKLLIDSGADINYRTSEGKTALSMARSGRDTPNRIDKRPTAAEGRRADVGENVGDSRDYNDPEIMKRARQRHDQIIELLISYSAR
jgi:hypothetical protein